MKVVPSWVTVISDGGSVVVISTVTYSVAGNICGGCVTVTPCSVTVLRVVMDIVDPGKVVT